MKVGDVEAEHFCVRVEIDRYRDPAHPEHEEIVTFDNWAQSNFDSASVSFGSPSDRVSTVVSASNALTRTATYLFTADQSTDWYRIFVGHAWLQLKSGASRPFELAYESLAGDVVFGAEFERQLESITDIQHHVALTSWLMPENTECDTPREWWGVGLDLRAGRRTTIDDVRRNGELVTAHVHAHRDGALFDVTFGELDLAAWPEDAPERVIHTEGPIGNNGEGRVLVSSETLHLLAQGRRVLFSLARRADSHFAFALTPPEPLN